MRSHPIDGAVLLGGCDKTTPGLVMGAISMGIPAIYVPAGPMLRGNWRGEYLGSGSDVWKYWTEKRAGNITEEQWNEMEGGIARSFGTCMVMGTAATMMAIAEALGLTLPGASSIPAADSGHPRMCGVAGRRIVDMVWEDLTLDKILTPAAFDNAIKVHMAMGGSTNAIIHVVAMARRAGIALDMQRFDEISRQIPVLANVRPSGKYLMEDFFYAGGLRALMRGARRTSSISPLTVTGKTVGENIAGAEVYPARRHPSARRSDLCRRRDRGAQGQSRAARLRDEAGRRRPALPQASRAGARLRRLQPHGARGRARRPRRHARPHLVLKNAGPKGGPGMPEWGMLPIPKKLVQAGVRDMVRISDARMSGTSYGACILHVAPESFVGGPLALVQTGDEIEIDVRGAPHPSARRATTSSAAAAPPGSRRRRATRAATARCSRSTSARPTRAATSIFCKARRRPRSRRFTNPLQRERLDWWKEFC